MTTKIRIVMRSFENHFVGGLPPHTRRIGLPESRVVYTVLRSPHIDKKSREQFSIERKTNVLDIKAETHELRKKYFWLKRLRAFGAQCEIQFYHKSRLDKGKLQTLLSASKCYICFDVVVCNYELPKDWCVYLRKLQKPPTRQVQKLNSK